METFIFRGDSLSCCYHVTDSLTHSVSQSGFRDITVLSLQTGHVVNGNHTHHTNLMILLIDSWLVQL